MEKELTRDDFRESVFQRDNHKCVVCGKPAVDAHHIIERKLFKPNSFGYFISNGASLCEFHHIEAESTRLSCNDIREMCGITQIIQPEHFYSDLEYDKWGNIILPTGERLKGELFYDESVQKILDKNIIFKKYIKYPRTFHVPQSQSTSKDDKYIKDFSYFIDKDVVVTAKMDGENCLDENTIIITEDGPQRIIDICENKYKGKVLSKNLDTELYEFKEVTNHSVIENDDDWYEIELDNGIKLIVTSNHLIYLPKLKCFRRVIDLIIDDEIDFLL